MALMTFSMGRNSGHKLMHKVVYYLYGVRSVQSNFILFAHRFVLKPIVRLSHQRNH